MIIKAKECHKKQIIKLWSNAFGDKEESVMKYLDTLLEYFLVYEEDGIVKGMLSVLPVTLDDKKGGYIYAVVTHPDYRKKGICKRLMDNVKADKNYDFLVLVPQNNGLFEFYAKMDFKAVSFLKRKDISPKDGADNYSIKSITAKEYKEKRNKFYKEQNFIKWDEKILNFAKGMYGGTFCEIFDGEKEVGTAFFYKEDEAIFIKEFLVKNYDETAEKIGRVFGVKKVNFVYETEDANPTFMVFPEVFSYTKFGIFLD